MTDSITFGKSGTAYMVNDKGTSIANANKDKVLKMDNIIENAKKDQSLKAMADTVQNMLKGSSGNSHYVYAGEEKYIGYAPVKGTAWVLAVTDRWKKRHSVRTGYIENGDYSVICIFPDCRNHHRSDCGKAAYPSDSNPAETIA